MFCCCALSACASVGRSLLAAGEVLIVSVPYLEKKIHPTVIIRGMQRALDDIVAHYQSATRARARACVSRC